MIEVKNLTKKYGDHVAVDNLSFTVEKGQIYGFLGPNGAGKTTTLNILTGCLAATEGEVFIDGHDIYRDAKKAKRLIGYLPEIPPLYPDMTPAEYLSFVGELKGIPKKELGAKVDEVMEKVQITDVSKRIIKNLSKGYKQRVGLAQAILGDPEIVILDEPTVGLDPVQIVEIREVIKNLADDHTVIFSSHILSEVSEICSYIMIISNGKLVAEDTTENLEKRFSSSPVLNISVKGLEDDVRDVLDSLDGISDYTVSENDKEGITDASIECEGDADISEALSFALLERKCLILKMEKSKTSLEDVFMELVSQESDSVASDDGDDAEEAELEVDADELLDGSVKSVWDEHMNDDNDDFEADDDEEDEDDGGEEESNDGGDL